ncbi:DUF4367 domain-containing protein [Desulfosporosinus youngiae]|uniref:Anti-sigma-W factor RsiW n=1 Tax=Desulfosporosinus youngiae DSM 17734 TaxID=768710 RepID=H5XU91_9FIRM|nr:DUF4367 domain-containing protein [Desulfosporosinus youngiae]EHQ89187.1 hypothetical protein DesyoDRAFT_2095 [Desulfosporosinus youngiae DSM 17734]
MKCPGNGLLQAYIDGELEIGIRKKIETHLADCDQCQSLLAVLKENDDFVFTKLKNYRQHFEECKVPGSALPGLNHQTINTDNKGVLNPMIKYRKFVAAACAVALVTVCVTVQPVKSAIASALSIFRVQNVKGITLSLKDLQQIENKLSSGQGEISLDKMGSIKRQGGQKRTSSPEEVKNLPDIVAFPSALDRVIPDVDIVEPESIDFTLNAKNVNQIMKSYGATKLLPDNIDGKTFRVDFASQVTFDYRVDNKSIEITQTKAPQITVPDGVNVDDIYNAVIEMPILPQNLQAQLKSIKDWKTTLYIPDVDAKNTEVDINGAKGYKRTSADKLHSAVIWYNKGVIYTISGNTDSEEILTIARSMR